MKLIDSRLEVIEELKSMLKDSENFEKRTIAYMKNKSDSFVMFRWVSRLKYKCLNYIHLVVCIYTYFDIAIFFFQLMFMEHNVNS